MSYTYLSLAEERVDQAYREAELLLPTSCVRCWEKDHRQVRAVPGCQGDILCAEHEIASELEALLVGHVCANDELNAMRRIAEVRRLYLRSEA